jgi:hypothetical protein
MIFLVSRLLRSMKAVDEEASSSSLSLELDATSARNTTDDIVEAEDEFGQLPHVLVPRLSNPSLGRQSFQRVGSARM